MVNERWYEQLEAYLDGELDDPVSVADFEHHLEHCRSCFTRIELEKMLNERMQKTARRESPQALRERIGNVQLIVADPAGGRLAGASDPRGEGAAGGY